MGHFSYWPFQVEIYTSATVHYSRLMVGDIYGGYIFINPTLVHFLTVIARTAIYLSDLLL